MNRISSKNKKTISVIVILMLIIMLGGCGYSSSNSNGRINIKFDKLNKQKTYELKVTESKKIKIKYSGYKLQKGSLELIITTTDGSEIYKKIFTPDTKSNGTLTIKGLNPNNNYKLYLIGKNAKNGKINISVNSEHLKFYKK